LKLKYGDFPAFNVDAVRPLFVVVSGAHAYGTARADSDLDIRGVRMPTLEWATSLARDESGVEHRFGNVDVSIHNVFHFLSVLLHGNGTFLENMFEERLHEDPSFPELRDLVMKYGVTKRFAGHYHGFIDSSIKDYDRKKRIKYLINGFRVAMAGIHLFLTGQVLYNLNDLLKAEPWRTRIMDSFDEAYFADLLNKYRAESDLIMPNEHPMPHVLHTLRDLQGLFTQNSSLVAMSKFPDEPKYGPFNEWLLKELLKDWSQVNLSRVV